MTLADREVVEETANEATRSNEDSPLRSARTDLGSENEHSGSCPSCAELRERLANQARDISELSHLIAPLKVENVRLSRSLKNASQMIEEAAMALRSLFTEPERREWLNHQSEDVALCSFFQRLITWYRRVANDGNPTLAFYKKIWQYERGGEDLFGRAAPKADVAASSGLKSVDISAKPDAVPKVPIGSCEHEVGLSPVLGSSASLYEACRSRAEVDRLRDENRRLQDENVSLRRRLAEVLLEGRPSRTPTAAVAPPCGRALVRTLGHLAEADSRWKLLLGENGDGLFSQEDAINETYELYLGDVLDVMIAHGCTFKRAVELSEAVESDSGGAACELPGNDGDL